MPTKTTPVPQADYADEFAYLLRVAGNHLPEATREYTFSETRKWRFDFAWLDPYRVAVEINGGRWMPGGGRHAEDGDYWKIASAAAEGWRVLPVTITMLREDPWRVLELLEQALTLDKTWIDGAEWIQTTPRVEYETRAPAGPCSAQGSCDCAADED